MQTYDANALSALEEINAAYEGRIVPFFSRGHVYVARNPDQAKQLSCNDNKFKPVHLLGWFCSLSDK